MLYIANIRLPTEKAYGIQIMEMCEAFSREGAEVTLVVPTRANPEFRNTDPFAYYSVEQSFALQHIKTLDPWWFMRLPQGFYIKAQAFFFAVSLYIQIVILKKYSQVELVYTRDEYLLPFLHKFFSHVVWEMHTLPNHPPRYINAWQKCHCIIAITKGLKDALVINGVREDHIMVAPDGVDIAKFQIPNSKFQIRQELGLPQNKKIILYSGHLYEWKGVQTLADAVRLLDDRFLAVFVGGTERDRAQFIERNRSNARIKVIGHQPHHLIPQYLNAADALVLPNSARRDDAKLYTSPMKLFEYMIAHAPIIASRVPALQEILNETNALFFSPDDPHDCAKAIRLIADHETHYEELYHHANKDVVRYSWQARAKKILSQLKI